MTVHADPAGRRRPRFRHPRRHANRKLKHLLKVDADRRAVLASGVRIRRPPKLPARCEDDFLVLPELIERFGDLGYDVVEVVLADQDSWDRYQAAQWLNLRRWPDRHPDDELAAEMRAELSTGPARCARYQREYLGWGVLRADGPLTV